MLSKSEIRNVVILSLEENTDTLSSIEMEAIADDVVARLEDADYDVYDESFEDEEDSED
jgi:hypothetical protein